MFLRRCIGAMLLAFGVAGCGAVFLPDGAGTAVPVSERRELPGRVYLLRGLIGDVFSLGMDDLAAKIQKRGVKASVHGVSAARFLANDIIKAYRSDRSLAPIMLIGHSTGGDEIITMAERLKAANIPVALAVAFDPTPIASDVPSNVELFINLYQATNLIGGGRATPGRGFRGRLINVDLRKRREIVHITLDKSPVIHELVAEKIVGIAERAAAQHQATQHQNAAGNALNGTTAKMPPPNAVASEIRPLVMKYVVPANARIELWDSAISVIVTNDDTLQTIASRTGAPAWAIAQINNVDADQALQPGRRLLVPHSVYAPGALGGSEAGAVFGAARVRLPSSNR